MKSVRKRLTTWGRALWHDAEVWQPTEIIELNSIVTEVSEKTPRGNGRCYGDAALGAAVIDMRKMNSIARFDEETGRITCEAGVLLSDIIDLVVPQGWFFNVTPGIKHITLGGAIASDVHGKNHMSKGCFGQWVEHFSLMRNDGTWVKCSRVVNADLFHQSFGAMGQTGIILNATIQLRRISASTMRQTVTRSSGISELLSALSATNTEYKAAWLDLLNFTQSESPKWVLFAADHAETPTDLTYRKGLRLSVPFPLPIAVLSPWLMRFYNKFQWKKADKQAQAPHLVPMDDYFYPLDKLANWNRLYGPKGFYQYQFCVPTSQALTCLNAVVTHLQKQASKPYLAVLKQHGPIGVGFEQSFPLEGFSLALDFPANAQTKALINELDDLIWPYGSKVYLAKDAVSHPRMSRLNHEALLPYREGFSSNLFKRITRPS